jgi:hypothetical protein
MPVSRQRVRDFYDARMSRDPDSSRNFSMTMWSGDRRPGRSHPVCGQHAARKPRLTPCGASHPRCSKSPSSTSRTSDRWRSRRGFNRLAAIQSGTGRTITYQRAEFFQFRDNKIMTYRAVLDSFDMAEQMLGHAINTSLTSAPTDFAANGDRIAL